MRRGWQRAQVCAAVLGFASIVQTQAADWEITPAISVGGVYTSNVDLAPTDERDDLVGVVTPGVAIAGEGSRIILDGAYRAQGLAYTDNSSANDLIHQLTANGTGMLVEDILFIDGRANRSRVNINNEGPIAIDNINFTDNQEDAWRYGLASRATFRLGHIARLNAEVGRDWIRWDDNDDVSDSDTDRASSSLESGEETTKLRWRLLYTYRDVTFDDEASAGSTFRKYDAQLSYRLWRSWSLLASAGYDDNDFESGDEDSTGSSWNLGLGWAPNERVGLDFGVGDRFFGTTRFLSGVYQSRRLEITAGYREDPVLASDFVGETTSVAPGALPPAIGERRTDTPTQSDRVFIRKRGDLAVSYSLRRGRFRLASFASKREFAEGDDEEVYGLNADWQWRLNRLASISLSGRWQRTDFGGSDREDNLWNATFRYTHTLGRRVEGVIELRYRENDSNSELDDWNEARAAAGIRMAFGGGA